MLTLLVDLLRQQEPAWSHKVERWYQLDEISYSFCEAIHHWGYLQGKEKPDVIILALEGASNLSDFDFVNTGATSPAKFVYTLPNISISVVFQILGHGGKTYCFNKGKNTLEFASKEGLEISKTNKSVWVFSSSPVLENNCRRVSLEILNKN